MLTVQRENNMNEKPNPITLFVPILAPLLLLLIYQFYGNGTLTAFFQSLNGFASENRYIFYPVLGAVVMIISSIRSIGFEKLKHSNHPYQAIFATGIIGALFGFFIAWVLKLIFH